LIDAKLRNGAYFVVLNFACMALLLLAVAPVIILLVYVYYRDKYEHEPLGLLFKGLVMGALTVLPVLAIGLLFRVWMPPAGTFANAAYNAFVLAALPEEGFKLLAVMWLIWKNPNFNERFDGIVYAVFVSLGFAMVENVMYVMGQNGGTHVGLMRAITAVPAHAIFGIVMGFRLGLARFVPSSRLLNLLLAFIYPVLLHGLYDVLLMSGHQLLLLLFLPLLGGMYWNGQRLMRRAMQYSPFNPDVLHQIAPSGNKANNQEG
jgi:protease PrsW